MTDAQHLIDYARKQFNDIAEDVERHFDLVAGNLKERFAKPLAAPPARRLPPPTTWQLAQRWMYKHKALTAAIVAFFVTGSVGTFVYVKSRDLKKKRRAKKSQSGARTDVVVVAGSVTNPLTNALYLDLERRGFVVYVVANTREEEHFIRSQSRADLVPLSLDLVDPFTTQNQLARFQNLLASEHRAFDHAEPHRLNFVGLVVVPDLRCNPARIEDISSEEWSDALNAKVLHTIATTQHLLPAVIEHKANVLFLTPSMTAALKPPMHSMESTIYGALQGFTSSLATELKQDGVNTTFFKLGNLDIPAITAKLRRDGVPAPRLKPTPLRTLHDKVFDTIVSKRPARTLHVGRGSLTYDLIGSVMPPTFIAWMMGVGQKPSIVRDSGDDDLRNSAGSLTWEKVNQERLDS